MKLVIYSLAVVLIVLLSGCGAYSSYHLELLKPAMVMPSTTSGKLLLIDNTVNQPADVGNYFVGLNKNDRDTSYTQLCKMDSFADVLLGYIAARIKSEDVIKKVEKVSVMENGIGEKRNSKAYLRVDSLDKNQRLRLEKLFNATYWVSLDGLLVESMEKCEQKGMVYPQTRTVYVRTFWRVYDETSDTLLLGFKHRDSLIWKRSGAAPGVSNRPMPSLESTLPEIADVVANDVYRVFTPYWEGIDRFYYVSGNLQLKLGNEELKAGNWEKAALYWLDAYKNGKGLNSFRASVNMMLYNESRGDVTKALAWAERAEWAYKRSFFFPFADELEAFWAWEKDLRLRLKEMELLNGFLN